MRLIRIARVAVLSTACFAALAATGFANDDGSPMPSLDSPAGAAYEGQVFNGDDMDPVLTVFSRSARGAWTGSYVLGEEEELAAGTLDECGWETALLLNCRWKDRHGTGYARLLFSSDFQSFRGFWGNAAESITLPWDGVRQ